MFLYAVFKFIYQPYAFRRYAKLLVGLYLSILMAFPMMIGAEETEDSIKDEVMLAFEQLKEKSFTKKQQALTQLIEQQNERTLIYLQALLDKRLYYQKDNGRVVIAEKKAEGFDISDARSGEDLGLVEKKTLKKISTNNKMRKQLRQAIAQLSLQHPDTEVRLNAVKRVYEKSDYAHVQQFNALLSEETDKNVRTALQLGILLAQLQSPNHDDIQQALNELPEHPDALNPVVRNQLNAFAQHENKDFAVVAQDALATLDAQVKWYAFLETLFFGMSLGSVLALAAIGLAITFGVMGVINMAHGELMMLGAYTTYIVQQLMPNFIDYSLWIAIPAAFLVSGSMGILIERTVIRHLYGRPLETLLATFGISLILQQLVRTLISPQNVPVANPSWMSGAWEINSVLSLTYNRLYIIIFCLMVFAALAIILRKTWLGLQVRAVSQNRAMAQAMGVPAARVDALTFGLGAGIAGVAGVALSQLTNVGPNLGQAYIIDSFLVVVFGGVGNLLGTLVSGLTLGIFNKVLEPWTGAVLAKILVLVLIILFIQKRPQGLFPQKGRAGGQ